MGLNLTGVLKRRQSSNRDRYRGKMMRGNREKAKERGLAQIIPSWSSGRISPANSLILLGLLASRAKRKQLSQVR